MRLAERLLGLTLVGADWVFWILIALSVVSVAVMVERAIRFPVGGSTPRHSARSSSTGCRTATSPARDGLCYRCARPRRMSCCRESITSNAAPWRSRRRWPARNQRLRLDLERNLGILGTLGNNAPFIGLFGTVLGIIKAFVDLSHNQNGGVTVVMTGIAEALVATALGLVVAIPAVIAFNYFQGRLRRILGRVDATANLVMVAMTGTTAGAIAGSAPVAASGDQGRPETAG